MALIQQEVCVTGHVILITPVIHQNSHLLSNNQCILYKALLHMNDNYLHRPPEILLMFPSLIQETILHIDGIELSFHNDRKKHMS